MILTLVGNKGLTNMFYLFEIDVFKIDHLYILQMDHLIRHAIYVFQLDLFDFLSM